MADARDELIAELRAIAAAQAREIEALRAEVAELKEKLRQFSQNSSKPPSSDGPAAPKRPPKKPTGRKPGGQPGHEGHQRALVPPEQVDRRVPCKPACCRGCSARLAGEDPNPRLHQVFELPQVKATVTQYELHSLACSRCGEHTTAELPAGVPTGAFGPSVTAMIALLLGVYRLGKRPVQQLLEDLFGLHMSLGAVIGCQELASAALAPAHAEAHAHVVAQPVKHADETGWREARRRAWLWIAVTSAVTVFLVRARRNGKVARELLGAAYGVLVSDRHGAYGWWPDALRQFCWAHLARDFVKIKERGGASEALGEAILAEKDRMFGWWHKVRDGTLGRPRFQRKMKGLQDRVFAHLTEGLAIAHPKTAKTCKRLLAHFDAMWTFVYREGVEPTNNAAELRIRHPVLWRKMSHGTHSPEGSRFVERVLTVHASLRQQSRNVLAFITDACVARLTQSDPPSLLPQSASARLAHAA